MGRSVSFELVLLLCALPGLYWGQFHLRRGRRSFGAAIFAAGVACAAAITLGRAGQGGGLLGVVGVGAIVCMLLLGPLARAAARRAAGRDRARLARVLIEIAEVLMPGAGVGEDKAAIASLIDVQAGRIDDTVAALARIKAKVPAAAGRELDERIALLYLSAHRWREAIDHVDDHLAPSSGPPAGEPGDGWAGVRHQLGMSPPLWVEVMGASARLGDLERTTRMQLQLEDACAERADAAWILHRGRLVLLAFAGRTAAVDRLLTKRRAAHMSAPARRYWAGIAAQRAGDVAAARVALEAARAGSRGRARALCDSALRELDTPVPPPPPVVAAAADALAEAPLPEPRMPGRRRVGATAALLAGNVAVAAFVTLVLGPSGDIGVLARAGAAVRSAIDAGEWWRVVSATFLHVGVLHLVLNMLGLWSIGRWTETLYGRTATLAIYGSAGLVGAAASYLGGGARVSAGASGAVLGVVGALVVELVVRRRQYRKVWQSGLAGNLVTVTVAQVGIGFLVPAVDQWAHLAGMVTGATLGLVLSPTTALGRSRPVRALAMVLVAGWLGLVGVAATQVVRTDYATTMARTGERGFQLVDVRVPAPAHWEIVGDELIDRDLFVVVSVDRAPIDPATGAGPAGHADRWAAWVRGEAARARDRGFARSEREGARMAAVPGWDLAELVAIAEDGLGGDQRYRVVSAGRAEPGWTRIVTVYAPDRLWPAFEPVVRRLLTELVVVGE